MAPRTTTIAINNAASTIPIASEAGFIRASFVGHAMDGANRAPVLAAGALPVMRLGAKTATAAAVHGLPFQQLLGEVAEDEEILARLAFHLVHGGIDQRHQSANGRTLPKLRC